MSTHRTGSVVAVVALALGASTVAAGGCSGGGAPGDVAAGGAGGTALAPPVTI